MKTNIRLFTYLTLSITLALCLSSCKKPVKLIEIDTFPTLKTPKGTVIGELVKKAIGADGGILAFPDGSISLNIPSGALTHSTEISIQEVTANPTIATARVYRLLPENVTFNKPIEVTINYNNSDGSTEDFLYLTYQDNEGIWHRLKNTSVDPITKSLKVTTTHFSDWSLIREVHLNSNKQELQAGEECTLTTLINDYSLDDFWGNYKAIRPDQIVSWKVINGIGSITGGNNPTVTYKAPASVDNQATAIIELTLKNLLSKSDPRRPGKSGIVIIRKELTLLPNEYVRWNVSGIEHKAMFYSSGVFNGETIISATSTTGSLGIQLNNIKEGTYDIGDMKEPSRAELSLTHDSKSYKSSYADCETFKRVYANGSITITKLENKPQGIIEGYFSATPVNYLNCTRTNRKVEGSFRIVKGN